MSEPRYLWRQLTPKQREELMAWRKDRGYPGIRRRTGRTLVICGS